MKHKSTAYLWLLVIHILRVYLPTLFLFSVLITKRILSHQKGILLLMLKPLQNHLLRSFCASEVPGKRLAGTPPELALVVFHTHGPYNAFCVQRSGWTNNIDVFLSWLSGISFSGGGFSEVPTCEGLAEALMILRGSADTTQNNQNHEAQKHCILVAASNPYPSHIHAYSLPIQCTEHNENIEPSKGHSIADPENIAKSFAQCSVSLSVISPKQLSALKAIYNAGKRNPRGADPRVGHAKNPDFLVLLSEDFLASTALNPPLHGNVAPIFEDFMTAWTALNPPLHGNVAPNKMKMYSAPAVTMQGPTSNANPSGGPTAMGLPNIGATPLQVHVSNTGVDSLGATAMNMPIEQHPNAQQQPPKFVKIWKGTLSGIRFGQPVFICRLEVYRRGTAAETLAADWPETLEIAHVMDREHMNNNYRHRAEFLEFRALNQHGFLGGLKEHGLCAMIRLPSQTLLLSASDEVGRLIGLLIPGTWKPPVSNFVPIAQHHQALQQLLQEHQHEVQLEQESVQQLQRNFRRQVAAITAAHAARRPPASAATGSTSAAAAAAAADATATPGLQAPAIAIAAVADATATPGLQAPAIAIAAAAPVGAARQDFAPGTGRRLPFTTFSTPRRQYGREG